MTKEEAIDWARRPSLREAAQPVQEPAQEPVVDLVAEGRPATLAEIVAKARRDLEAVGGFDNGLIGVPASGVRLLIERLEAALAEPQEPGCRDDGMPTSAEERHLRRLLALRAAMPHAYYDDGEAQGTEHGISIDFMREPVAHIDAKLRALNVARAIAKQAEPVQDHLRDATKMVQEPVATVTECEACFTPDVCQLRGTCDYYAASQMRIAAPPQRPAEPQGCDHCEHPLYAGTRETLRLVDELALCAELKREYQEQFAQAAVQRDALLEALKGIVAMWDHHCYAHGDGQPTPLHVQARAAIKAVEENT